jgi:hypothetical protein
MQKNWVIFSKCDNVIENIQIHMSWWFYFFNLKFHTNVKNKYEKEIFDDVFFLTKMSLDFQNNENHVVTFSYWFWCGSKFLNV